MSTYGIIKFFFQANRSDLEPDLDLQKKSTKDTHEPIYSTYKIALLTRARGHTHEQSPGTHLAVTVSQSPLSPCPTPY